MKKIIIAISSLIISLGLVQPTTAQAWFLDEIGELFSSSFTGSWGNKTRGAGSNAEYCSAKAGCEEEIKRVKEEANKEWERYREARRKQYDLRLELKNCWNGYGLLEIELERCRDANGGNPNNEEASDSSYQTETSECREPRSAKQLEEERRRAREEQERQAREASNSSSSGYWDDFIANGTCSEPRSDQKREECLEQCQGSLAWAQHDLEEAREHTQNVEEKLREDIQMCREWTDALKTELDQCRGDSVPVETTNTTTGTGQAISLPNTLGVPIKK